MAMLPRSIYATAGRRAYGDAGVLPADDKFSGLQRAKYAVTEWGEHVAFPQIGFLTVCWLDSCPLVSPRVLVLDPPVSLVAS